jgi:glucan 1,3-beta-glucosidase
MMSKFTIFTLFVALCLFLFVSAAPSPAAETSAAASSDYWVASIARQGTVPFGASGYQVFRNVKDFGAVGDGKSHSFIFLSQRSAFEFSAPSMGHSY